MARKSLNSGMLGSIAYAATNVNQITIAGWVNWIALGVVAQPLRVYVVNGSNNGWYMTGNVGAPVPGHKFISCVMDSVQLDCDDSVDQTDDWRVNEEADGNWHHFALTGDSDPSEAGCTAKATTQCFIDGINDGPRLQNKGPTGYHQTDAVTGVAIFCVANAAFAEIGIWNRVLSDAEIANLGVDRYTPSLISSGLLASWRMLGDDDPEPGDSTLLGTSVDMDMQDGWTVQYAHPSDIVTSVGIDTPTIFDPTSSVDPEDTIHFEKAIYGRNNAFIEITDYNASGTTTEWRIWPSDPNARFPFLTRDYPKTYTTYGGPYGAGTYKTYRGSIRHLHLWLPPLVRFNYRFRQLGGTCTGEWSNTRTIRATA